MIRLDDVSRIAFEVDRTDNGTVAVYVPGSPDPWAGRVVYMTADRVEPLEIEYGDALATFEQLGRGSAHLAEKSTSQAKTSQPNTS